MENLDYEKTIEHQFDSFCKTVLRNQARNLYHEMKNRSNRFISLEQLTQAQLNQLSVSDDYESNYIIITTHNYDIQIENALIATALCSLSKKKKDIILLSFFLNMTNVDIAERLNLAESTVHYHKKIALKELKKFMEEHSDGE